MDELFEILHKIRPECDFKSSNDFINDRLLDSFDVANLIAALDETYDISIDGEDIIPENIHNIEKITALLQKYRDMM
jgi:acyl carrier protein